jgi:hypothetical protein
MLHTDLTPDACPSLHLDSGEEGGAKKIEGPPHHADQYHAMPNRDSVRAVK